MVPLRNRPLWVRVDASRGRLRPPKFEFGDGSILNPLYSDSSFFPIPMSFIPKIKRANLWKFEKLGNRFLSQSTHAERIMWRVECFLLGASLFKKIFFLVKIFRNVVSGQRGDLRKLNGSWITKNGGFITYSINQSTHDERMWRVECFRSFAFQKDYFFSKNL